MIWKIRPRFAWKLFLSYLAVLAVGAAVLLVTSRLALPGAFLRHMADMGGMMGPGGMMGGSPPPVLDSFRDAFTDAITLSGLAALSVAVVVSALMARRVVAPVRRLTEASRRIAAGHYDERVDVGSAAPVGTEDEIGQLARQFNEMAAELETTEARRMELIGNVAHELRTPLTIIRGSLEGLMDGVLAPEPETIYRITREADRLQRLVMDLQELSRVEAGAVELHLDELDLGEVMNSAQAQLAMQFEEKGVSFELQKPTPSVEVRADRDRLMQVLLNLLGNALQYTPSGGSVMLKATQLDGYAEVSVQDTGIGLQSEHLDHVFDRFYRVDRSRSRAGGGSGIGLTIARHLIEAHGGQIRAESPGPGQGSVFHFTIPSL